MTPENQIRKPMDSTDWIILISFFSALAVFWVYRIPTYATLFLVGFVINEIINYFLKRTIQAPRPNEDKRLFQLEKASGRPILTERYGMPSHHAQIMWYITVFLGLTLKSSKYNLFACLTGCLVSLYVCFMRVKERKHTFLQVLAGSIVGGILAAMMYYGGGSWIMKKREGGIREDGFLLSKNFSFG